MTWAQLGATIAIEIGVCSLLDFVLSNKEIERSHLSLVRWWNELDEFNVAETVRRSPAFFVRLFDIVYGPRAFSWKRAGMSILTTLVAVFVVWRIPAVQTKYQITDTDIVSLVVLPFIVICMLISNLIVDFISYNKTAWILKRAEDKKLWQLGLLLILDVVLTVAIYIVGTTAILAVPMRAFIETPKGVPRIVGVLGFVLYTIRGNPDIHMSPFFFATFATSVLFYLFLLSSLAVRILGLSRTRLMTLIERLERSDQLFKSIGAVLGALLAIGKGIADFVVHLK